LFALPAPRHDQQTYKRNGHSQKPGCVLNFESMRRFCFHEEFFLLFSVAHFTLLSSGTHPIGVLLRYFRGSRVMTALQEIETAPKDGSKFLGKCGEDYILMFWHPELKVFCSSFRRLQMAEGYSINGKSYEDHSPVTHTPSAWIPSPLESSSSEMKP